MKKNFRRPLAAVKAQVAADAAAAEEVAGPSATVNVLAEPPAEHSSAAFYLSGCVFLREEARR